MQDILSLVALGVGLVAGIYMHLPTIQFGHLFLIMLAGFGALVLIVWFLLSVQI